MLTIYVNQELQQFLPRFQETNKRLKIVLCDQRVYYNQLFVTLFGMELEFNAEEVLKVDEDGFICCSGRDYMRQARNHTQEKGLLLLSKMINVMGERSAISQKLKQVITTTGKFYGTDQRIYIKVSGNKALGFVKVGQKKLFYHDYIGSIKQLTPTAVLDIYVHESCQRHGIGKEIFQKFLKAQGKLAEKLAYDRPSEKLISFLKKHYKLSSFIPQNNNYVIFDRFFGKEEKPKTSQTHSKTRNQPILEKINMNTTKVRAEQEDSLNKLAREMAPNNQFQGIKSFKQSKDQARSSFGCPWAIEEKIGFRTTSNTYGNYYKNR